MDSRVEIVQYENRGGGAALNFFNLISKVDGRNFDYFALSDQDDIWLEDKLHQAIYYLENDGGSVYSSGFTAFWSNGKTEFITKHPQQRKWDFFFESGGPGCSYVFKNFFYTELRNWVCKNHCLLKKIWQHDWFIYAYARSHNFPWLIADENMLLYRQHDSNVVGVNRGIRALIRRLRIVMSGQYRNQARLYVELFNNNDSRIGRAINAGWLGSLFIACNIRSCRRSTRDRIALFFLCIFNIY